MQYFPPKSVAHVSLPWYSAPLNVSNSKINRQRLRLKFLLVSKTLLLHYSYMKTQPSKMWQRPCLGKRTRKRKMLLQKLAAQTSQSIFGNCEALDFNYFKELRCSEQHWFYTIKIPSNKAPFWISLPQSMVFLIFFFFFLLIMPETLKC